MIFGASLEAPIAPSAPLDAQPLILNTARFYRLRQ